jgi:hypothetical protein
MTLLLRDFVSTTLTSPPAGTSGTSLTVVSGDGELFPTISSGDKVPAVIEAPDGTSREAVVCTGRSGDTFVIERGPSPVSWTGAGQNFYLTLTAAAMHELARASAHSVVPAGGISSTTVQAALEELDTDLSGVTASVAAVQGSVDTLEATIETKAPLDSPTFTGPVTLSEDAAEDMNPVTLRQLAAYVESQCFDVGDYKMTSRASLGAGRRWLLCDAKTIGGESSGASALASVEAQALFEHLWGTYSNTLCPIQDSAGVAATRGATALEDFAAGKRLPLLDWRGLTPRMHHGGSGTYESDVSRVLGSYQSDAIRNITGSFQSAVDSGGFDSASGVFERSSTGYIGASGNYPNGSRAIYFDASNVVPTAPENRMRNRSLNMFIRY